MSPLVSVFTPSHRTTHLGDCYESLCSQVGDVDWEWIVVLNGGAYLDPDLREQLMNDPRVRLREFPPEITTQAVGFWKRTALTHAVGDYLLELDHDDVLVDTCIQRVVDAFEQNPDASLVYSNTVQINEDGSPNLDQYDAAYGWSYRDVGINDVPHVEAHALPATPHNVSLIWYAPNHVRAFRRTHYDKTRGYDSTLAVCDDHDLVSQLFQVGNFVHINEALYLQRVHDRMTQRDPALNADIQRITVDLYSRDIAENARAWGARRGLHALDIGCGNAKMTGFTGVDAIDLPGVDVVTQLPNLSMFDDNSCAVVRACDALEHVADQVMLMAEIHRILVPGGLLLSLTPSTDGRGAWQDPTHVSFWNENSFWYWTDDRYIDYSPQHGQRAKVAFQASLLRTFYPSDFHREHDIPYVQANLIAIKARNQPRNGGLLLVDATTR